MSRKCDGANGGSALHPLYDALGTGHYTGLRPPDHRLTRFTMPSAPVTAGLRQPDHRLIRFTMPSAPGTAGLDDRIKAWRANGNRL